MGRSKVTTIEDLKSLVGLEQFYGQVPLRRTWVLSDKKVKTMEEAIVILNEIEGD